MLKRITLFLLATSASFFLSAQVTTSSISGTVKDNNNQPLTGATITAKHLPSGTVYSTTSAKDGGFGLNGLRIGGPYQVKIDFVGFKSAIFDGITLLLGEPFNINGQLSINEQIMENVVITTRTRKAATDKTGMSTVINNRLLSTLPSISRSITDFTRAIPQANGNNFGGRDGRYNNITVDGANLNNNFGLSTDPLPGGGNNPVSLDAIEELSVSLAPYDVRQGNFTGGNIAAITKSGTNSYHGTFYTYWQNEKLRGTEVAGQKASNPAFKSTVYGGSIGGAIIKNKLFYFVNAEFEQKPPAAGITWSPKGGSGEGNISDTPVDSLQKVASYLSSLYKYDPGVYDNFSAFKNENHKILAKIDWNISTKHKLSVKYSDFKGNQDFQPSQSGNIGGTFGGATYGPKFSASAMAFSGTLYQQEDIVKSGSLELNSNLSNKMSNQFLATYTKIQSDKSHSGDNFPFIDILGLTSGDKRNYISVGNEPFNGNNNKVHNDVLSFTENFTYRTAKHHTITAGVSYEFQKVGNMFMAGSQGYYVYGSLNDFVNNYAPLKYAQTYSLIEGQEAVFSAQLKIGQISAYAQDEINVSPLLKLTIGVRMDKPVYPEQPLENKANSALTFMDLEGNSVHYNNGMWPDPKALFSPRFGFRYDVHGDKTLIFRGGTGIFTGRIPYVYLTNIPTTSGMYQYSASISNTSAGINMNNYRFSTDPHAYNPFYNTGLPANYFPTVAGTVASASFVVTDPGYKFPQVWRTDIAVDQRIGKSWKLTIEALYTKDINATYMFDANQKAPDATVQTGSYTRGYYSTANNNASRRINSQISGNAIVLASTNKGSSFVLTTELEKQFVKGLSGALAYTYTYAGNITENPGSQAASVYAANTTGNTLNDFELAYSNFALPHRIVGHVSYRFEYIKHMATTIAFVYEGAANGKYSYVYNGSLNNQGFASANLMYVPKDARDASEIQFKPTTYNGVTYTSAEQGALFEKYILQDPYLREHRGQVVERNGAQRPWYNRLDMKFLQDVFIVTGKYRHTIQFSADIYNIPNLLHNHWGARQIYTVNNPLKVESVTNGVPTFSITPYNGAPVTRTFIPNISTSNTWAIQLGLRYIL